jgi:hypothetical protein
VPRFAIVTDEDLARAHADPVFHHKLVVANLQKLIELMTVLRSDPDSQTREIEAQIREGANLAVKLSDIVKRLAPAAGLKA